MKLLLYQASVSDKDGRIFSLEEIQGNEGRSIEDYLSDMVGIINKRFAYVRYGYIYFTMSCEKSFIKLYFQAINFRDAVALAERLAPLHRKSGS